jgi:hypothetical protein
MSCNTTELAQASHPQKCRRIYFVNLKLGSFHGTPNELLYSNRWNFLGTLFGEFGDRLAPAPNLSLHVHRLPKTI